MGKQSRVAAYRLAFVVVIPLLVVVVALVGARAPAARAGLAIAAPAAPTVVSFTFLRQFGISSAPQLSSPERVALDGNGDVYVVDSTGNQVVKYDASGNFLAVWTTPGIALGPFTSPYGIAVDGAGNVFVADTFNNRILKLDSSGNWSQFAAALTLQSPLKTPYGVATDGSGNVYVADTGNCRVLQYPPSGDSLSVLGTGCVIGKINPFADPVDVAVDGTGNVFVADATNNAIQELSAATSTWGQFAPTAACSCSLLFPQGVATDSAGNVYVADSNNEQIKEFSPNGSLSRTWGTAGGGTDLGQLDFPNGVAADSQGNVYVADTFNARIQKFDASGSVLTAWGNGSLSAPQGEAIDPNGEVDVVDALNARVRRFTASGGFVVDWPITCDTCSLTLPVGIAVDRNGGGSIYVADPDFNQVDQIDVTGQTLLQTIGSFIVGGQTECLSRPWGVAVDGTSNVYVADYDNNRVVVFDSSGNYVTQWGGSQLTTCPTAPIRRPTPTRPRPGTSATPAAAIAPARKPAPSAKRIGPLLTPTTIPSGAPTRRASNAAVRGAQPTPTCVPTVSMDRPDGVAVDATGDVYVTEYGNNRVDKFDTCGDLITQWGSQGSDPGQFFNPDGIAVDATGNVYVSDFGGNRVEVFDPSGNFLTQIGSSNTTCPNGGAGPGQLNCPTGLAVDSNGNVYISDQNNNRVEVFQPVDLTVTPTSTGTSTSSPTATPSATVTTTPTATITPTTTPTGLVKVFLPFVDTGGQGGP